MNSHKSPTHDPFDPYIAFCIRHWLAQMPPPPAWGKARLLRVASLNPVVRRKNIALAPALLQLMQAFRRAFIDLILHITMQPEIYSFPIERRFSSSGSYNLSQLLVRNVELQSRLTGTEIFCLIS
jgi:hypothetical protein